MYGVNSKNITTLGVLIVCAMLLTVPSIFLAEKMGKPPLKVGIAKSSDKQHTLCLVMGNFVPGKELTQIPPELQKTETEDYDYYILQFKGPVDQKWKEDIEKEGVVLHDYLPNDAFIASMNREIVNSVFSKEYVNYIGIYQPYYKVLVDRYTGSTQLHIWVFSKEKIPNIAQELRKIGFKEVKIFDEERISAKGTYLQVIEAAKIAEVKFVEKYIPPKILNDLSSHYAIRARDAWSMNRSGLPANINGSAICAAVLDTGFGSTTSNTDRNDPTKVHYDFFQTYSGGAPTGNSRVVAILDTAGDGNTGDLYSGHGTHCAGSVLGNGFRSGSNPMNNIYDNSYAGMAPQAKLIFQAGGTTNDGLSFTFSTALTNARDTAISNGYYLNVHSNSWGSSQFGPYQGDSISGDTFMWNNRYVLVTTSAGNDGPGYRSVGLPATAKNLLTVGAAQSLRQAKDVEDVSTFDLETSFSSRGPTTDLRIKPDITAVGSYVISTKSPVAAEGLYGGVGEYYEYCSGTSMSNPVAAGAAVLVYDYFYKVQGIPQNQISASLVKAMLINGARDMGYGVPSYIQGWGMVDIENTLFPKPPRSFRYVDNTTGLSTGGSAQYQYTVASSTEPLKITLVWTDYPGANNANPALVNDLNLVVTDPNGNTYYGNYFSNSWSVPNPTGTNNWDTGSGTARDDDRNNVECVYVRNPAQGTWTINVTARTVPNGPQPFSLVVSGDFGRSEAYRVFLTTKDDYNRNITQDQMYYVLPGMRFNFTFNITNFGTNADTYTLTSYAPSGYTVQFSQSNVALAAGETRQIYTTVTVPASETKTLRQVMINASSGNARDSLTLRLFVHTDWIPSFKKVTNTSNQPEVDFDVAVNSTNPNDIWMVYVAPVPTSSLNPSNAVPQVFAIRSQDGGYTWGSPTQLSTSTTTDQKHSPKISIQSSTGKVAFVWVEQSRNLAANNYGQNFLMFRLWTGTAFNTPVTIRSLTDTANPYVDNNGQIYIFVSPCVILESTTNYIKVFYQYSQYTYTGGSLSGVTINLQWHYSTNDGATWSAVATLTGSVTDDAGHTDSRGYYPEVTEWNGRIYLVYYKLDGTTSYRDIYYMYSSVGTTTWSGEISLETNANNGVNQDMFPVVFSAGGKLWIAWSSWRNKGGWSIVLKNTTANPPTAASSWSSAIVLPILSEMSGGYYDKASSMQWAVGKVSVVNTSDGFYVTYPVNETINPWKTSHMKMIYSPNDSFTSLTYYDLRTFAGGGPFAKLVKNANDKNVMAFYTLTDNSYQTDIVYTKVSKPYSLTLRPGWNLVSSPLESNTMYASLIGKQLSAGEKVRWYNAFTKTYESEYVVGTASNNTFLPDDYAFWVNVSAQKTITLNGSVPDSWVERSVYLSQGYNQIGWTSLTNLTTTAWNLTNSTNTAGEIRIISRWNASAQMTNTTDVFYLSLQKYNFVIEPGRGYWVWTNTATTLRYRP
ncbi:MAG: S8 family serine peptidase [Thermoplasmata archaeon]|nr:S8 family serine peptidase [Thermoplasmata archaeon]